MNFRRCLSFVVALSVALSVVCLNGVTVSAAETNQDAWIELLETTSVQSNGENWFEIRGRSGSFSIPLHTEKRLAKIDVLVWHQTAERISTASVAVGSSSTQLTVVYVGQNVSRVYGSIPNAFYENITVNFTKSTSTNCVWEVLSCRVTPFAVTEFNVDATVWMEYNSANSFKTPGYCDMPDGDVPGNYPATTPINVHDWEKYDSVTVFGSLSNVGLVSVRAIVGNVALPFEMSFTSSLSSGSTSNEYTWTEYKTVYGDPGGGLYDEVGHAVTDTTVFSYSEYGGTTLYSITIDLSGIDRTKGTSSDLQIHFTYIASTEFGYRFNVAGASGAIFAADTSEVTWWNRFTTFMEGLFAGDSDTDVMQQVAGQSQDLAEDRLGAVAQAGAVIDGLTGAFQNHGVMDMISFPALTINFGGVPWTFGGWNVSVIPPGFEPLVQTLKLIIDIVATLAFLQAMRSRLERLLVGGNA